MVLSALPAERLLIGIWRGRNSIKICTDFESKSLKSFFEIQRIDPFHCLKNHGNFFCAKTCLKKEKSKEMMIDCIRAHNQA